MLKYFKDWLKVISKKELHNVIKQINSFNYTICPNKGNIFKVFNLCEYNNLKVVMLGYDPYPQLNVATGIAFGNNLDICNSISPSLQILKDSVINLRIPHNSIIFDHSLESWCKQGVLLLNSALTTKLNQTGYHINMWRPFIRSLLENLSRKENGIIYVLFGETAQTFSPYINDKHNIVLKEKHPSYYARLNQDMPSDIFNIIDEVLYKNYGERIKWYNELNL